MGGLVVEGAEVAAVGVPAAGVVPAFDPFEDHSGERVAVGPVVLVEQFELEAAEERLDDGVVVAVPGRPVDPNSPASRIRWPNSHDV